MIAPTQPNAELSVGVAIPAKMDPSTQITSKSGGKIAISALTICLNLLTPLSSFTIGATSGLR